MVILAIDLGETRTGLALCDEREILAFPICTIYEKNRQKLAEKILQKCQENKAEKIVLGLPKNMDGTEGEKSTKVRKFAQILNKKIDIPIEFYDERRTTIEAGNILKTLNVFGKKRKEKIDSLSATLILESFISKNKQKTKPGDIK